MRDKGFSLQESVDYVGAQISSLLDLFNNSEAALPSFGPKVDRDLEKYILATKQSLIGHIVWSFDTHRYFGPEDGDVKHTLVVQLATESGDEGARGDSLSRSSSKQGFLPMNGCNVTEYVLQQSKFGKLLPASSSVKHNVVVPSYPIAYFLLEGELFLHLKNSPTPNRYPLLVLDYSPSNVTVQKMEIHNNTNPLLSHMLWSKKKYLQER